MTPCKIFIANGFSRQNIGNWVNFRVGEGVLEAYVVSKNHPNETDVFVGTFDDVVRMSEKRGREINEGVHRIDSFVFSNPEKIVAAAPV